jgi:hypothetical protein
MGIANLPPDIDWVYYFAMATEATNWKACPPSSNSRRGPIWCWAAAARSAVEMQVRAAEPGLRVTELPVHCLPRQAGRSKISGSTSGVIELEARSSPKSRSSTCGECFAEL